MATERAVSKLLIAIKAWGRDFLRRALGDPPGRAALLLVPTAFGIVFDAAVRHPRFVRLGLNSFIYLRGAILSLAFWVLLLWILAKLPRGRASRVGGALVLGGTVFPVLFLTYGAQWSYFEHTDAFFQANTFVVGWAQRATLMTAARSLLSTWLAGALLALALTSAFGWLAARLRPSLATTAAHLPLLSTLMLGLTFAMASPAGLTGGIGVLPPDASFFQALTGWIAPRSRALGMGIRVPLPTPTLDRSPSALHTVILIISESLRADTFPSAPSTEHPSFLDGVAPDRFPMLRLRTQASSTVLSCFATWSGLPVNVDASTTPTAPLIFEIAKSAGYRTVYIGSQLGSFQTLSTFLRNAGIDERAFAEDLTTHPHPEYGADDEIAFDRALQTLRAHPEPTFAVVHLSSTHYPYMVRDELAPNQPMSTALDRASLVPLRNRYKNAVLLQERSLARFLAQFASLPNAERTAMVFLSDHGEQFWEHGAFSHTMSLHDEEIHIPGFVLGGARALTDEQRGALALWRDRYAYNQDIFATVLDLLGVWEARGAIPLADRRSGRSLLRPPPPEEPVVLLANENPLWEDDNPAFGAAQGNMVLQGRRQQPFACVDRAKDPGEMSPLPASACPEALVRAARNAFPVVPGP